MRGQTKATPTQQPKISERRQVTSKPWRNLASRSWTRANTNCFLASDILLAMPFVPLLACIAWLLALSTEGPKTSPSWRWLQTNCVAQKNWQRPILLPDARSNTTNPADSERTLSTISAVSISLLSSITSELCTDSLIRRWGSSGKCGKKPVNLPIVLWPVLCRFQITHESYRHSRLAVRQ